MNMNDLDECVVTPADTIRELEELENQLAERLNITIDVEETLWLMTEDVFPITNVSFDYFSTFAFFASWVVDYLRSSEEINLDAKYRELVINKAKKYKSFWNIIQNDIKVLNVIRHIKE